VRDLGWILGGAAVVLATIPLGVLVYLARPRRERETDRKVNADRDTPSVSSSAGPASPAPGNGGADQLADPRAPQ
jgi:hypothetical protein